MSRRKLVDMKDPLWKAEALLDRILDASLRLERLQSDLGRPVAGLYVDSVERDTRSMLSDVRKRIAKRAKREVSE